MSWFSGRGGWKKIWMVTEQHIQVEDVSLCWRHAHVHTRSLSLSPLQAEVKCKMDT